MKSHGTRPYRHGGDGQGIAPTIGRTDGGYRALSQVRFPVLGISSGRGADVSRIDGRGILALMNRQRLGWGCDLMEAVQRGLAVHRGLHLAQWGAIYQDSGKYCAMLAGGRVK